MKYAEDVNTAEHERGVDIVVTAGSCVHITCRQKFTDKKDISLSRQRNEETSRTRKRSYRISDGPYDNRTQCFFCGTLVVFDMKSARTSEYVRVRTDTFAKRSSNAAKAAVMNGHLLF